ncbi:GNAT family N-acetyltransferase [Pseudomonas sp. TNT3]|uniref:GNAT family N-acetyltransferase n=1 Tax=Pseudomonas sp. TNT3 TaxID=2654097 RepID=UPI001390AAF5|nr:GNAT family N-acetyltransferase [Pseudomonas sp. TNT3]KAI2693233.1 GNAT family N-acetyltransferase [Pseudomonas sp. TNT3]
MQESIKLMRSSDWACAEQMVLGDPDRSFADAKCNAEEFELLMIEFNGKKTGFVLLGYWNDDEEKTVEVSKFLVLPPHRGKDGISLAAARAVFSLMSHRSYKNYTLQSLNSKASHFWRKALSGMKYREDGNLFRIGEWDY